MPQLKVIVSTDQALLRDLLALAIQKDRRFVLAGEAGDALAAARLCRREGADVLVVDFDNFQWENLDAFVKAIRKKDAKRVLGLTGRNDPFSVQRSLEAGFSGVFEKTHPLKDFLEAVVAVGRGERCFSEGAERTKAHVVDHPRSFPKMLTRREQQIVSLVGNYLTSRQIAEKLGLSVRTVETHRYNIMQKLQIPDAPGLIRYAVENGLDQLTDSADVAQ